MIKFQLSRICKQFGFIKRSARIVAGENSLTSYTKISEKEQGQQQPMNSSTYEDDFPPLSANKSKQRTRIDLGKCSKQKQEMPQKDIPLQREASNSSTSSGEELVNQNIGPLQREVANLITCSKQNLEVVHNIRPHREASTSTSDLYFPPLSANKSKQRTRIDLGKCSKQKPEMPQKDIPLQREASNSSTCSGEELVNQNIGPLQREVANLITCSKQNLEEVHNIRPHREASTSTSDLYDAGLPTSFGKKQVYPSKSPKVLQTHHEQREAKRRPKPSSSTPIDEPFDICPHQTLESVSCVNKRTGGELSVMRQPAAENEQNKGITEGNDSEDLVEESASVLGPGMVLLKHYIRLLEQVNIVNKCRELGCGPGGFYRPGYNDGAKLRLYMMCLGLDWNPQTASYGERRCHDNAAPPLLPNEFISLVCRALHDSHSLIERTLMVDNVDDVLPKMCPDLCIVNFYTSTGRLGLHQDRDETRESLDKKLPVVSISIGDSAEFLYGKQRDVNKAKSVLLESGDVLIFGGESRHIYHGVKAIVPNTAPPALLERTGLQPGRLNLTFRKY